MRSSFLIVGLGNPGKKYVNTRHNIGANCVQEFVEKHKGSFRKNVKIQGEIAKVCIKQIDGYALIPTTYMNLSGIAVAKALNYYNIALKDLLIVTDDVEIAFGTFRVRAFGSSGGHNGLKNIKEQLSTSDFARLRIGVDKDLNVDLSDYVLSTFNSSQKAELEQIYTDGVQLIDCWITDDTAEASQLAGMLSKKRLMNENKENNL